MVAWSVLGTAPAAVEAVKAGVPVAGGVGRAGSGVVPGWFGFHMLIQFLCVSCRRLQRGFRAETTILLW